MTTRKQKQLQQQAKTTETQTPDLQLTGTEDKSVLEGTVVTESTTTVEAVTVEETPEVAKLPEYTQERILVVLGDSPLAARIAPRLAHFLTISINATTLDELVPVRNSLNDILNLMNKAENAEFIKMLSGLSKFIHEDLEEFNTDSIFKGARAFRAFMGATPPEARLLETLIQLAPVKTRKATISRWDGNAITKFLVPEKKELFVAFFKE